MQTLKQSNLASRFISEIIIFIGALESGSHNMATCLVDCLSPVDPIGYVYIYLPSLVLKKIEDHIKIYVIR